MSNERIEAMITQLYEMLSSFQTESPVIVAGPKEDLIQNLSEQKEMDNEIKSELEQIELKDLIAKIDEIEIKSEQYHQEYLKLFHELKVDIEIIWEKTSKIEREFARLQRNNF